MFTKRCLNSRGASAVVQFLFQPVEQKSTCFFFLSLRIQTNVLYRARRRLTTPTLLLAAAEEACGCLGGALWVASRGRLQTTNRARSSGARLSGSVRALPGRATEVV